MSRGDERRRAMRVHTPGGEAFCHVAGQGDRYAMANLSAGGVRLKEGPALEKGKKVDVVLFAAGMGMVALHGRVVDQQEKSESIAVAFEDLNYESTRRLTDLVTSAILDDLGPHRWTDRGPL